VPNKAHDHDAEACQLGMLYVLC